MARTHTIRRARRAVISAVALASLTAGIAQAAPKGAPHATALNDRIMGTQRADLIAGRGGDDVLIGLAARTSCAARGATTASTAAPAATA